MNGSGGRSWKRWKPLIAMGLKNTQTNMHMCFTNMSKAGYNLSTQWEKDGRHILYRTKGNVVADSTGTFLVLSFIAFRCHFSPVWEWEIQKKLWKNTNPTKCEKAKKNVGKKSSVLSWKWREFWLQTMNSFQGQALARCMDRSGLNEN